MFLVSPHFSTSSTKYKAFAIKYNKIIREPDSRNDEVYFFLQRKFMKCKISDDSTLSKDG